MRRLFAILFLLVSASVFAGPPIAPTPPLYRTNPVTFPSRYISGLGSNMPPIWVKANFNDTQQKLRLFGTYDGAKWFCIGNDFVYDDPTASGQLRDPSLWITPDSKFHIVYTFKAFTANSNVSGSCSGLYPNGLSYTGPITNQTLTNTAVHDWAPYHNQDTNGNDFFVISSYQVTSGSPYCAITFATNANCTGWSNALVLTNFTLTNITLYDFCMVVSNGSPGIPSQYFLVCAGNAFMWTFTNNSLLGGHFDLVASNTVYNTFQHPIEAPDVYLVNPNNPTNWCMNFWDIHDQQYKVSYITNLTSTNWSTPILCSGSGVKGLCHGSGVYVTNYQQLSGLWEYASLYSGSTNNDDFFGTSLDEFPVGYYYNISNGVFSFTNQFFDITTFNLTNGAFTITNSGVTNATYTNAGHYGITLSNGNIYFTGIANGNGSGLTNVSGSGGNYQPASTKLTNFSNLANSSGVLTNDGAGNYSWVSVGGGTSVNALTNNQVGQVNFQGPVISTNGFFSQSTDTNISIYQNNLTAHPNVFNNAGANGWGDDGVGSLHFNNATNSGVFAATNSSQTNILGGTGLTNSGTMIIAAGGSTAFQITSGNIFSFHSLGGSSGLNMTGFGYIISLTNEANMTFATNGFSSLRSNTVSPTSISFPASGVNWTNPLNCMIEVYINNPTVTGTGISKNGTTIFTSVTGDVTMHLQVGEYFSETYTVGTPTATYSPY